MERGEGKTEVEGVQKSGQRRRGNIRKEGMVGGETESEKRDERRNGTMRRKGRTKREKFGGRKERRGNGSGREKKQRG